MLKPSGLSCGVGAATCEEVGVLAATCTPAIELGLSADAKLKPMPAVSTGDKPLEPAFVRVSLSTPKHAVAMDRAGTGNFFMPGTAAGAGLLTIPESLVLQGAGTAALSGVSDGLCVCAPRAGEDWCST